MTHGEASIIFRATIQVRLAVWQKEVSRDTFFAESRLSGFISLSLIVRSDILQ